MTFPRMHISLYVSDLEKTLSFYTRFFGVTPEKVRHGYAKFHLIAPSLVISFVENADRTGSQFGHLGFQVETEDLLKDYRQRMQNQNISLLDEEQTNCCYALQDKFWVSDPDGYQWEVYYFHEDVEFNDPRYSEESNAQCCIPEAPKKKVQLSELNGQSCTPGSGCC